MKGFNLLRVFFLCVCCVGIVACGETTNPKHFNVGPLSAEETEKLRALGADIPDNAVKIRRYTGKKETVIIPESIKGNPVIWIDNYAFSDSKLKSVTIPYSVLWIGASAFSGVLSAKQFTSIVIPDSVLFIDERAFYQNQLTSVVIGNSVTEIGIHAFSENPLVSVTIPESVRRIGDYAFREPGSDLGKLLETINIGSNVEFDSNAFHVNFWIAYRDNRSRAGKYVVIRNGGKNRDGDLVDTWGRAAN
jgi:hypothetical protein